MKTYPQPASERAELPAPSEHEQPAAAPTTPARGDVVILPVPSSAAVPHAPAARTAALAPREPVHVAANLHDLVVSAPIDTPQERHAAKEQRDLNEVVHGVLIIGLAISTFLMLAGVALAIVLQRDLPTNVPDIAEVISRTLALRPSGVVSLGLLVLIATPILRVIGSIGAFLYERDWRFASVTILVLAVLFVSLLFGRG